MPLGRLNRIFLRQKLQRYLAGEIPSSLEPSKKISGSAITRSLIVPCFAKSDHALRETAAVRLAKDGHSDHEIMAMGGWDTLKEVARYTKGVRRKRLAENVLKKAREAQE